MHAHTPPTIQIEVFYSDFNCLAIIDEGYNEDIYYGFDVQFEYNYHQIPKHEKVSLPNHILDYSTHAVAKLSYLPNQVNEVFVLCQEFTNDLEDIFYLGSASDPLNTLMLDSRGTTPITFSHELGHVFGLEHTEEQSIMSPNLRSILGKPKIRTRGATPSPIFWRMLSSHVTDNNYIKNLINNMDIPTNKPIRLSACKTFSLIDRFKHKDTDSYVMSIHENNLEKLGKHGLDKLYYFYNFDDQLYHLIMFVDKFKHESKVITLIRILQTSSTKF